MIKKLVQVHAYGKFLYVKYITSPNMDFQLWLFMNSYLLVCNFEKINVFKS
jgi:hypothetical protein